MPSPQAVSGPYATPLALTQNRPTTDHPTTDHPVPQDFSPTLSLTIAAIGRLRRPLLSGGASQLQRGYGSHFTPQDARVRRVVSWRPVDSLQRLDDTGHDYTPRQEIAGTPAIWGTARVSPSRISSGQLLQIRRCRSTFLKRPHLPKPPAPPFSKKRCAPGIALCSFVCIRPHRQVGRYTPFSAQKNRFPLPEKRFETLDKTVVFPYT